MVELAAPLRVSPLIKVGRQVEILQNCEFQCLYYVTHKIAFVIALEPIYFSVWKMVILSRRYCIRCIPPEPPIQEGDQDQRDRGRPKGN